MKAWYVEQFVPGAPLDGLTLGELSDPPIPEGWKRVGIKMASLNHHDVWSLRGVGLAQDALPMVLGTDGAGVTEQGDEVIVHAVISGEGFTGPDETLDPSRTLLSERYWGTLAEAVWVPPRNLIPKPAEMSWETAASTPTAYLTAYRMLVTRAECTPGERVLIQGAGGGVATACIQLGRALGLEVWVTTRDPEKAAYARSLGADEDFESGSRLPGRVDCVVDSVGEATWSHSLRALRPGGRLITCGATSGTNPSKGELNRIFFLQLSVIGSTMGTRAELARLLDLMVDHHIEVPDTTVLHFEDVREGLRILMDGQVRGKIVVNGPS